MKTTPEEQSALIEAYLAQAEWLQIAHEELENVRFCLKSCARKGVLPKEIFHPLAETMCMESRISQQLMSGQIPAPTMKDGKLTFEQ